LSNCTAPEYQLRLLLPSIIYFLMRSEPAKSINVSLPMVHVAVTVPPPSSASAAVPECRFRRVTNI